MFLTTEFKTGFHQNWCECAKGSLWQLSGEFYTPRGVTTAPGLFPWFPSLETVTVLPFTEKAAPPEPRRHKIIPVPLLLLPHPSADNTDNRANFLCSLPSACVTWDFEVLCICKYMKTKDYRPAMLEPSQDFMETWTSYSWGETNKKIQVHMCFFREDASSPKPTQSCLSLHVLCKARVGSGVWGSRPLGRGRGGKLLPTDSRNFQCFSCGAHAFLWHRTRQKIPLMLNTPCA